MKKLYHKRWAKLYNLEKYDKLSAVVRKRLVTERDRCVAKMALVNSLLEKPVLK